MAAQQCLQQRRRRELRRAAESASHGVLVLQRRGDRVVAQRGHHRRPAAGQPGRHRPQLTGDLVGGLLDLVAPGPPGVGDGGEQLQEVRLRVVGAAEERPAVGGEETRHRPAALPGQRDGGVHVHRVEVGPLFAVDLDAHEAGVHRGRDLVVLERLVGHHVAPVAGGVADRQQDRHVARGRLGQRLGRPLPPVHRVVGVLAQVRAGRLDRAFAPENSAGLTLGGPASGAWSGSVFPRSNDSGSLRRCRFIDHTSRNVPINSSTTISSPNGLALPKSGPVLRGASSASRPTQASTRRSSVRLDPGEQVGLRQLTGTRERASSNSSVGHSRCCHSMGAAKKSPSGSIWVAWARSASSRWEKYFEHSTRVVTRSANTSWSGSQCLSHLSNGPCWPCLANSSCSNCMRFRRKPWL